MLMLAGAAIAAPSSAHADTGYGYCQASGCNGLDPYYENCEANAYIVSYQTYQYPSSYDLAGDYYAVDLWYSPDCEANWAEVWTSASYDQFCVRNNYGDIQTYTSAPAVRSWTNMVNGDPGSRDAAYLELPEATQNGETFMWADDGPASGFGGGYNPC